MAKITFLVKIFCYKLVGNHVKTLLHVCFFPYSSNIFENFDQKVPKKCKKGDVLALFSQDFHKYCVNQKFEKPVPRVDMRKKKKNAA